MDRIRFYAGPLGPDTIAKDLAVCGANVYGDPFRGQGCNTVWFRTVAQARKIIKRLGRVPSGYDAGLCEKCKCHYRWGSRQWRKARDYACKDYKRKIAGTSQS